MRIWNISVGVVCALAAVTVLCGSGVFFETGSNWYSACWHKAHDHRAPNSPEEAAFWVSCRIEAENAFFGAGFIAAGNPNYAVTPQLKAIQAACPSAYTEIPLDGPSELIVGMVENAGGPALADRVLPARFMIANSLRSRWPNCSAAREANGFPRRVKKGDDWEWASPCLPCKGEETAMKDQAEQASAGPSIEELLRKRAEGATSVSASESK